MNVAHAPAPDPTWAQVQAREPAALEALLARWMPTGLQWVRRLGGPRIDAEQVAQEVFIVVLRRLHTVHSERAFPGWLYSVCKNCASQARREAFVRRWDADQEPASPPAVMDMEGRDALQRAWALLEALPDDLREVLVLCDLEGRTDAEAAQLIGIPVGTAKSRLRRARAQFRAEAAALGRRP